ncbi:MAG: hypothetical protein HZB16_04865 [Armatimonadetes bacterium]|nr:hypothetical protein [Armatimonadota bacterium]
MSTEPGDKCPNCGGELPAAARGCPACGAATGRHPRLWMSAGEVIALLFALAITGIGGACTIGSIGDELWQIIWFFSVPTLLLGLLLLRWVWRAYAARRDGTRRGAFPRGR